MQAVEDANMPRQDNTTAVVVNVKELVTAAAATTAEPETVEEIGETTAEIDISSGNTIETVPLENPVPTPEPETVAESKSKTGLFIGIAAAVIILIGVGGFFAMGKKPAEQTETLIVASEPDTSSERVEEETISEDTLEVVSEESDVTEEVTAPPEETAVATVAAVAEQTKAEADISDKTIQDTLKSGGKGPVMAVIPAGKFLMGSTSSKNSNERPRREVTAEKFAISQYEITFAEYDQFAEATGRKKPDSLYMDRATHPVIFVTSDDAFYYTKWLSEETGEKYRLASEAEWEYAASSGKKSTFWWGYEEEPNRAHCFGCGTGLDPRKPTKVGSFDPNPFSVYDTAGNVAEWVHDCWHDNYKGAPKYAEVWEGGDCAYRIARGGAYSTPPQSIRSARRDRFKSDQAYDHIGIIVVREIR